VDLNQPCPECFREEDGKWFYPCPSDDCVLHDARLIAAAPDLLEALRCCEKTLRGVVNNTLGDKTSRDAVCSIHALGAAAAIQQATQP
jgi:hypothetical protein